MRKVEIDGESRIEFTLPFGKKEGRQLEFPEEVFPRDNKLKRSGKNILIRSSLALALATEIVYLGVITEESISDYNSDDDGLTPPAEKQGIDGIADFYGLDRGEGIDEFDKAILIDQYKLAKLAFTNYGSYELLTYNSSETTELLKQGRRSLLIDGANLINKVKEREFFQIDEEKDSIKYLDQDLEFKLGDTYSEFLLGGIIDQLIEINSSENPVEKQEEAIAFLKDLIWLSGQNLPIELKSDSYSFPNIQILSNMSRLYRTLAELKYPAPSTIIFGPYSKEHDAAGWYTIEKNRVIVTSNAKPTSIVHEEAHHQADENPQFSQERFDEMFQNIVSQQGLDLENKDIYVSDYAMKNLVENYAEVIEAYFTDGIGFRNQLKSLYLSGNPAYEVKKVVYEFAQDFFGGKQYLRNGEEFFPAPGQVFKIEDPDPNQNVGIYLREEPKVGDEEGRPRVFGNESVRILDGPKEMTFSPGKTVLAWKVEPVISVNNDYNSTGFEGWIWEIWLGDRIRQ